MDQPGKVARAAMTGSLVGIERVNWLLRGTSISLKTILPIIEREKPTAKKPFRICDIGTASADIPIALVKKARRRKISLYITAVEINPDLAAVARNKTKDYPEITIVQGDAREILRAAASKKASHKNGEGTDKNLPAPASQFDLVSASLFLHHFTPDEVVDWLSLMQNASTKGVIINDLERHIMAWIGIKLVGPILCRNRVFLSDAPLSVRRSYTPEEWSRLGNQAAKGAFRVSRHWPWRIVLASRKPAENAVKKRSSRPSS